MGLFPAEARRILYERNQATPISEASDSALRSELQPFFSNDEIKTIMEQEDPLKELRYSRFEKNAPTDENGKATFIHRGPTQRYTGRQSLLDSPEAKRWAEGRAMLLISNLEKILPSGEQDELNPSEKEKVQKFFQQISWFIHTPAEIDKLRANPKIFSILTHDVAKNDEKIQAIPEKGSRGEFIKKEQALLRRRMKKVAFAAVFRQHIAGGEKGKNGTSLLQRIRAGGATQIVACKKPGDKYVPRKARFKNGVKKTCWGQLRYLPRGPNAQSKAEVAAFYADRIFGFNMTPPSYYEEETGNAYQMSVFSFFKYQQGGDYRNMKTHELSLTEAKDRLDLLGMKKYSEPELNSMALFSFHDYLIGNLDCHDENYFVLNKGLDGQKTKTLEGLAGVDKANSFPLKQPKAGSKTTHNQYAWGRHKISRQPIPKKAAQFLLDNLTSDNLNAFWKQVEEDLGEFATPEMKSLMEKRRAVLYKFATEIIAGEERTLSQLSRISDEAQIEAYLSKGTIPRE